MKNVKGEVRNGSRGSGPGTKLGEARDRQPTRKNSITAYVICKSEVSPRTVKVELVDEKCNKGGN